MPRADQIDEIPGITPVEAEDDLIWDSFTQDAVSFAKDELYFEPPEEGAENGFFRGRHIIGRGTRIDQGVFFVKGIDEACVVDGMRPELSDAYLEIISRMTVGEKLDKQLALQAAYDIATERIPYNLQKTNELVRAHPPGTKIDLGFFIGNEAGVCRHQALLAGLLLERLKDDGVLRGTVSVRRNCLGESGHAWAEYETFNGLEMVIDPAQRYFGRKDESVLRGHWRY